MINLFETARAEELKKRAGQLRTDSERLWGKMNVAQAVAHCAMSFDLASGTLTPPRVLIGRLIGGIIKPLALGDDKPIRRNSPTIEAVVVQDQRNLEMERDHLCSKIDQFVAAGPQGCTTHPHSFFGRLTPEQWAILMYKHVDHHLRQFGA